MKIATVVLIFLVGFVLGAALCHARASLQNPQLDRPSEPQSACQSAMTDTQTVGHNPSPPCRSVLPTIFWLSFAAVAERTL